MTFRNRKLLDLARGMPCAHCGRNDGTTVAAHSNQSLHGKAKSLKAHDAFHAHLCHPCHAWLDQGHGLDPTGLFSDSRADKVELFNRAMHATWLLLWQRGLIRVT